MLIFLAQYEVSGFFADVSSGVDFQDEIYEGIHHLEQQLLH
jgi:hypothetical protein